MGEKTIVEAFKTFFERSVAPCIMDNNSLLNQWKFFNNIISADPIDYSQIDFYLHMANKPQNHQNNFQKPVLPTGSSPQPNIDYRNKYKGIGNDYGQQRKTNAMGGQSSMKKKNLIGSLESFQMLLLTNQDKLENFPRREAVQQNFNASINNGSRRYM